jgi:hypothetical protein
MYPADEQIKIAIEIDARVLKLERNRNNEVEILVKMYDYMPKFKELMDTSGPGVMDQLCTRFDGFYRYAKILENLAAGISSGEIEVP